MLQSADGIRRPAAGSNSHYYIPFAGLAFGHVVAPARTRIFTVFGGVAQGFVASGNYVLNGSGVSVEGGRTLSGIQRGEAATGPGAYVNQPSAAANGPSNGVNGGCDLGQGALHRGGNLVVFMVDDAGNFQRGKGIKAGGSNVLLLSPEIAEFGFAGTHAVQYLKAPR
jgi:hypothetical protein